jgi:predicted nuclease of predicted toxin-antitoxin system
MKLLADENIEREFVLALRAANIHVISAWESYIGFADDEILQISVDEKAVILTYDTDFGELVFRFSLKSHGIILLRLSGLSLPDKVEKTISVIQDHQHEIKNAFTVISENSVRIRKSF